MIIIPSNLDITRKDLLIAIAVTVVFLGMAVGISVLAAKSSENERIYLEKRMSAMGRTFALNGHIYTSINTTFGGSIECVSADAPEQVLSVSAVLALVAQYDAAKKAAAPVEAPTPKGGP